MVLMNKLIIKITFLLLGICALFLASQAKAVSINDIESFYISPNHSLNDLNKIQAKLIKVSSKNLFYVEKSWWDSQTFAEQSVILNNLNSVAIEFENKIYPTLTSMFGIEWRPGIDNDERITILFHQMKKDMGGYFRSADELAKIQVSDSNQREMLYLPIAKISSNQLKILLGHELIHLITYNQKTKTFGIDEEVWLNEARAEYASSILGYDDIYAGSNLQKRVNIFLSRINDSITEWSDAEYDYAIVNVFLHYLVDHYGVNILKDSLKSKYTGIESINYALSKNGYKDDFSQVFTNWTIATLINDCSVDEKYCYKNTNLSKIKINPVLNFLPLSGDSSLSVTNVAKNWSGNWQKIIGGKGSLTLKFSSLKNSNFKIPYVIYDKDNNITVNYLFLDSNQEGEIKINDFGIENMSLVVLPTLQTKTLGLSGVEFGYPYSFTVSIKDQQFSGEQSIINKLLDRIEYLKAEIAKILAQKNNQGTITCSAINSNLFLGMKNNLQVSCLQNFLKKQGSDIYPEGLVTGNFGSLTYQAVIRFQDKYKDEILTPSGMQFGNGYVGLMTRAKINKLLINN